MFQTAFIDAGPNVWNTTSFISDLVRRRLKLPITTAALMLFSVIFVLLFSTLASALSGYTANTRAMVEDRKGDFIRFNKFQFVEFIIHDGTRVGLTNDFPVVSPAGGSSFSDGKSATAVIRLCVADSKRICSSP